MTAEQINAIFRVCNVEEPCPMQAFRVNETNIPEHLIISESKYGFLFLHFVFFISAENADNDANSFVENINKCFALHEVVKCEMVGKQLVCAYTHKLRRDKDEAVYEQRITEALSYGLNAIKSILYDADCYLKNTERGIADNG